MADVSKSGGTFYRSPRSTFNAGSVSPGAAEAIDKIFPSSPSNFLQDPFSSDSSYSTSPTTDQSCVSRNDLSMCTTSSSISTSNVCTKATAMHTGLSSTVSGTKSPIMSTVAVCSSDLPSSPASSTIISIVGNKNNQILSLKSAPDAIKVQKTGIVIDNTTNDLHAEVEANGLNIKIKKKKKRRIKEFPEGDKSDSSTTNSVLEISTAKPSALNDNSAHQISRLDYDAIPYDKTKNNSIDSLESYPPSIKVQQKLPRVSSKKKVNLQKDQRYIRKKFLPCFIVAQKVDSLNDNNKKLKSPIELKDRVELLARLCAKDSIDCPRKDIDEPQLHYRNIFEDVLITNSEDEFISPRGRSLRKRNQNISYVEPSEEDLLEALAMSKRRRSKQQAAPEEQANPTPPEQTPVGEENVNDSEKSEKVKGNKKREKSKEKVNKIKEHVNNLPNPGKTNANDRPTVDKDGKKLVYVYPKGSSNQAQTSHSSAPVTTLSLPSSIMNGSGTTTTTSSASAKPTVSQPVISSNYYMVKIDGKDFLVPIMSGSVPPRTASSNISHLSSTSSTSYQMTGPRTTISPAMVSSGPHSRFNSNFAIPSGQLQRPLAIQPNVRAAINSSLPVRHFLPTMRHNQVLPRQPNVNFNHATSISTLMPAPLIMPAAGNVLSSTPFSNLPVSSIPNSLPQPAINCCTTSLTTTSTPIPAIYASASQSLLRNIRPATATPAALASHLMNATSGNSSYRIILPACNATGMPARIATLGLPINSSPLTRMAMSSSLLPQPKRSADNSLTPEQKAAKRRRLEKKYPLPPGVVIKTDPDEPPRQLPATTAALKSLLHSNVRFVNAGTRTGVSGLQNIRIITNPTGLRQMRLGVGSNANVVIRAPTSSTGALNSIAALVDKYNAVTTPQSKSSSSTSVSSANNINNGKDNNNSTNCVSSTERQNASNVVSMSSTPSVSTPPSSNLSNSTSERITTLSFSILPTASATTTVTTAVSSDSRSIPLLSSTDKPSRLQQFESLKASVETLKSIIEKQESIGLQSERLKKLKDVLFSKQKVLGEMEKELGQIGEVEAEQDGDGQNAPGLSASDPLVID